MLVILESTTYPGTTDELVLPMLEKSGLKVGADFFLCFSPERVDPGNAKFQTKEHSESGRRHHTRSVPKLGKLFYSQALEHVVPVSSTQVAEMVKLLENTFRMINIGLVNEIAIMCDGMGINVWEVIDAAATKPFGFMPFYPGPGLGGHCIPIDPFYLSWKTKQAGIEARFHRTRRLHQRSDAAFRCGKNSERAERVRKPVKGSKIHIYGVAYKRDIDDVRESPALDIMLLLKRRGAQFSQGADHLPHGAARRCRRVDSFSERMEFHATGAEVVEHRDQVAQAASRPVESPYNESVARPQCLQTTRERRALQA
jgi:UDP-N-acetyl-D-glucosamine dehydrogenase